MDDREQTAQPALDSGAREAMSAISVVIASKVGAPFLDQCLESLHSEALLLGAEVIVVMPDESAYATRIAREFPWARVVTAPELRKTLGL